MMHRGAGCGCLVFVLALALASYIVATTELGRWVLGLLFVYGGAIFAQATFFEVTTGNVTEINRLDPPTQYSAGSIRFSYIDGSGQEKQAFRRVTYSTVKFRGLEVGDRISVSVCRHDPEVVELVGYGTHEPGRCMPQGSSR